MRSDGVTGRHRVAVLVIKGVIPFELGIPSRIFGCRFGGSRDPLYDVVTCAAVPGLVETDMDFPIVVERGPQTLATADTVIIPATHDQGPECTEGRLSDAMAEAFEHIRPGTRMVSICTGSYFLAAAGLLDGRPATTHWQHTDHFQRTYPKVKVDPEVLFVDDGDVLTSAGVGSGLDLCLHIVRRDHGTDVANRIARQCVVPPWRDGGQAQYIERPLPPPTAATTGPTRAWAMERLDQPLPLTELASHAGMSVRTFTRRFRDEVGVSPGQWLTRQRVEQARRLLESSDLTVDLIAHRTGFGTAASLRQHLHAVIGVSPMVYRRTFRPAAGPADFRAVS
ncbi:GlxA family transcriptional regulator [Wenjunlia tyrosinilytica]|nr:helix-turn-helix domain-containing protein [Wenjunlia tyrosinilytica]